MHLSIIGVLPFSVKSVGQGLAPAAKVCAYFFAERASPFPTKVPRNLCGQKFNLCKSKESMCVTTPHPPTYVGPPSPSRGRLINYNLYKNSGIAQKELYR